MRKVTTSLAVLAALFCSASAQFAVLSNHLEADPHTATLRSHRSVDAALNNIAFLTQDSCDPSGGDNVPPAPEPIPPSPPLPPSIPGGLFPSKDETCTSFIMDTMPNCDSECRPD